MLMMDMTKKVLWHRPKNDESYLKKKLFFLISGERFDGF